MELLGKFNYNLIKFFNRKKINHFIFLNFEIFQNKQLQFFLKNIFIVSNTVQNNFINFLLTKLVKVELYLNFFTFIKKKNNIIKNPIFFFIKQKTSKNIYNAHYKQYATQNKKKNNFKQRKKKKYDQIDFTNNNITIKKNFFF
jgi:hypothetical protein